MLVKISWIASKCGRLQGCKVYKDFQPTTTNLRLYQMMRLLEVKIFLSISVSGINGWLSTIHTWGIGTDLNFLVVKKLLTVIFSLFKDQKNIYFNWSKYLVVLAGNLASGLALVCLFVVREKLFGKTVLSLQAIWITSTVIFQVYFHTTPHLVLTFVCFKIYPNLLATC